ncbi:DiGeorge syndrome critical region 14-like protein [Cavenderia fasciculata]|uniref:DiGeorge syndrome critical region 14-like protein n=1 Tax=Cavenderia fasciculata TaxID=261658 RepID=F4Q9R7_CACFS|nr:DiGeorge syndrome critical region 14-like protein [Cavenderia fasciculata]EGG15436.1 DiGeorge syndrome critical region 14-like protein [Cavenderia fasciculata]|eukprot:XP_004354178.1 DiGeorge syndrome critical region 14-like protein [Cavenderia fasciculata]
MNSNNNNEIIVNKNDKEELSLSTTTTNISFSRRDLDNQQQLGSHNNPNITILEEEQYVDAMSKIIQRDFYPDLPHLKQQLEWMDALESNDTTRLRTIQMEGIKRATTDYQRRNLQATPQSFDTPRNERDREREGMVDCVQQEEEISLPIDITKDYGLDEFVANFSSQDDQSYMKLQDIQKQRDKNRASYRWNNEKKNQQNQLLLTNDKPNQPQTWSYTIKNQLMFIPDSNNNSNNSILPKKEIVHSNTKITIVDKDLDEQEMMNQHNQPTPMMELLSTPSIIPGISGSGESSPMMTWGKIDGTPQILQPQTPIPSSLRDNDDGEYNSKVPAFKIPQTPKREKLANQLLLQTQKSKQRTINSNNSSPLSKSNLLGGNSPIYNPIFKKNNTLQKSPLSNNKSFQSLSPAAKHLLSIRSSPMRKPIINQNNKK